MPSLEMERLLLVKDGTLAVVKEESRRVRLKDAAKGGEEVVSDG
jgi:hypothetical protein